MKPALHAWLVTFFLLATPALAHDDHGKPRWGGVVSDAGDFQAELVLKGGQAKLYLSRHADMLPAQGASGKLTLLVGADKEEMLLKPVSDSALGAETKLKPGKGAKAVAVIQLPGQPPATLRFAVK
jgi:hypothetical protein